MAGWTAAVLVSLLLPSMSHGGWRVSDQQYLAPERGSLQSNSFTCGDGSVLPDHHVNDGECHCEDGSDEPESSCHHNRFTCTSMELLWHHRVADGSCDCCDGSDEPGGVCSNTCGNNEANKQHPGPKGLVEGNVFDSQPLGHARDELISIARAEALAVVKQAQEWKDSTQAREAGGSRGQMQKQDSSDKVVASVGSDTTLFRGLATAQGRDDLEGGVSDEGASAMSIQKVTNEKAPNYKGGPDGVVSDDMVAEYEAQGSPPTIVNKAVLEAVVENDEFGEAREEESPRGEASLQDTTLPGYYQHPTMFKDTIVFVSEDDLWKVSKKGGTAKRLTVGLAQVWRPRISPEGSLIAFSASDEGGPDVYVMPVAGGTPTRLTYMGDAVTVSWSPDGHHILFTSTTADFHTGSIESLQSVPLAGGQPRTLQIGPSSYILQGSAHCFACTKPKQPCEQAKSCADECLKSPIGCVFNGTQAVDPTKDAPATGTGTATHASLFPSASAKGKDMYYTSVIGRTLGDISHWKYYKGGRKGTLWVDLDGSREYEKLVDLTGNIGLFAWVGEYIVFTSDYLCKTWPKRGEKCVSNLFSVPLLPTLPGDVERTAQNRVMARNEAIQQLTFNTEHYVRNPTSALNDNSFVYTMGADVYTATLGKTGALKAKPKLLKIRYSGSRIQRQRQFRSVGGDVRQAAYSPNGGKVAFLSRGRPFIRDTLNKSPTIQLGVAQGVRYTQLAYLAGGDLLAVSDEQGESGLEVFSVRGSSPTLHSEHVAGGRLSDSIGRIRTMAASPTDNLVALVNHQKTLLVVDISTATVRCQLHSETGEISGLAWSPDGRWIAFSFGVHEGISIIKIMRVKDGQQFNTAFDVCNTVDITEPMVRDSTPAWDPEGRYLYFVGVRDFGVKYDSVSPTCMNFVGNEKPFLVLLNGAQKNPFINADNNETSIRMELHRQYRGGVFAGGATSEVMIDVAGIKDRIIAFDVATGDYGNIVGLPMGMVLFERFPLETDVADAEVVVFRSTLDNDPPVPFAQDVRILGTTNDKQWLSVAAPGHCVTPVRSVQAGHSLSGTMLMCLQTDGLTYEVDPSKEWRAVWLETWKRARDNFWSASMHSMDWEGVRDKYLPLLDRINARSELTDLVSQLQGELGTSHAFQRGGQHRRSMSIPVGALGADVRWDKTYNGYMIEMLYRGDLWKGTGETSPLTRPGLNVNEGDVIRQVNRRQCTQNVSLHEMLLGKVHVDVVLEVIKMETKPVYDKDTGAYMFEERKPVDVDEVTVLPSGSERAMRYREWINGNMQYVNTKSNGRIGYLHIPSMMDSGWREMHRAYVTQAAKEALIVDVRYNTGGRISDTLLDKLSRKTLGYMKARYSEAESYPHYSTPGPKVALINEYCASDCEIFSQTFCARMRYNVPCLHSEEDMKASCRLIGTRTWGGVVGIDWKGDMWDNSATAQPEYAHWFINVKGKEGLYKDDPLYKDGWSVEGAGVSPDDTIEYLPQDFHSMYKTSDYKDPQLDAGIKYIMDIIDNPTYTQRQKACVPDLHSASQEVIRPDMEKQKKLREITNMTAPSLRPRGSAKPKKGIPDAKEKEADEAMKKHATRGTSRVDDKVGDGNAREEEKENSKKDNNKKEGAPEEKGNRKGSTPGSDKKKGTQGRSKGEAKEAAQRGAKGGSKDASKDKQRVA